MSLTMRNFQVIKIGIMRNNSTPHILTKCIEVGLEPKNKDLSELVVLERETNLLSSTILIIKATTPPSKLLLRQRYLLIVMPQIE